MSAALMRVIGSPVDPSFLVPPVYSPPLLLNDAAITANGGNIFEGNWRQVNYFDNTSGDGGGGAAIIIDTQNPVTITNSIIDAQCYGIHWKAGNTQLTIRNSIIMCRNTSELGLPNGVAINSWGPRSLIIENCTLIGAGVQIDGTGSPNSYVRIRYNRMLNPDGRRSDGAGGYVFERSNWVLGGYWAPRMFVQFRSQSVVADGEVAWNEIINYPFVSRREDAINIYGASGVSGKPLSIHDNVVVRGHPSRPYDVEFSGCGFLVEDGYGGTASYIDIDDNQVIGAGNCAINIYDQGTHNIRVRRNRLVSCGRVNGKPVVTLGSACNIAGSGTMPTYVSLEDNGISWRNSNIPQQYTTWWHPTAAGNVGNSETGTYSIASPTTEATEVAEWKLWLSKKASAGVTCGSSLAI